MARTKVTLQQEKRGGEKWVLQTRAVIKVGDKRKGALITSAPPTPAKEAPLQAEEIMCQIAEVEQLEGVGRSPSLLPTWQLAQIAVEAMPSTLGKEEPVRRKLWLTMGCKAPQKEFLQAGKMKKTREVLAWYSCFLRDPAVPKEHRVPLFRNSPSCS